MAGAEEVFGGTVHNYHFVVTMKDGSRVLLEPEWTLEGGSSQVTVDEVGNLTAGLCEEDQTVALEGEPLNPAELLELKPMVFDKANRSYILYSTDSTEALLRRGTAVWLYNGDEKVRNMVLGLVAKSVEGPSVAPEQEAWSLAGAVDDEPGWLEQVTCPFFRWEAEKGFVPAELPEAGQGYWVKLK